MSVVDFNFSEHAADFDAHISASIPRYDRLRWWCEKLSRRFVQDGTRVLDVGCSSGSMLKAVQTANQSSRPKAQYVGIDLCPSFRHHWREHESENLRFEVRDAFEFDGYGNASLAILIFALQFMPERRKVELLQRIHAGLVDGGALLIAEKTLAGSSALQEAIALTYYDYKRSVFTAEEILDKERRLRGVMTLWTRRRLLEALYSVGFQPQDVEAFWQDGPFIGLVARKQALLPARRHSRLLMS